MLRIKCISHSVLLTLVTLRVSALALLAVGHGSPDKVSCADCTRLCSLLEARIAELESEPLHSSELVGEVRPRRRMMHTRSELDITRMLDSLCTEDDIASAPRIKEACNRLIPGYRDKLEDHIFSEGQQGLKIYLCGELSRICRAHDLLDNAGEL